MKLTHLKLQLKSHLIIPIINMQTKNSGNQEVSRITRFCLSVCLSVGGPYARGTLGMQCVVATEPKRHVASLVLMG